MPSIIESYHWRSAIKKFDPTKKLGDDQLSILTEAARLAPSSAGLAPWRLIVVSNPEIKAKLREAAHGQAQLTDASHIFVFAAQTDVSEATVDRVIESTAEVRSVPVEALAGYSSMVKGLISSMSPEQRTQWAARQAYIGLGFVLAAAAVSEIDACPMEGFDPKAFDEILGLGARNLEARVIAAAGFRAADDVMSSMKKVRFPKEEFVIEIK